MKLGNFLIFNDAHDEGQATAINPRHVAAVRSGPEISSFSGDDFGTSFIVMPDGGTYHVRGYFRDVVDALTSGAPNPLTSGVSNNG